MKLELLVGPEAWSVLESADFLDAWSRLASRCPWTTVFQTPAFVLTWYEVYRSRMQPLLLLSRSEQGELQGFFPLAESGPGDAVCHAGSHHAEYQVWLADPGSSDGFARGAFAKLLSRVRDGAFTLRYIPPGVPMQWLHSEGPWRSRWMVRDHSRGWMDFGDGSEVRASLRKSANKSKLRRLGQGRPVRLAELKGSPELSAHLGVISAWCDLRQGAINATLPFRSDPLKSEFFRRLAESGTVLHCAVLWAAEEIVAAHLGFRDGRTLGLGLIAHSPLHARNSPGKLLLLLLAEQLQSEGVESLDLTPGGGYKEQFATRTDTVQELLIDAGPVRHAWRVAEGRFRRAARRGLEMGVRGFGGGGRQSSGGSGDLVSRLRQATRLDKLFGSKRAEPAGVPPATRVHLSVAPLLDPKLAREIHRDCLDDLLAFEARPGRERLRTAFFSLALKRFEGGMHSYSAVRDGRLAYCGWMGNRVAPPEARGEELVPAPEPVLTVEDDDLGPESEPFQEAGLMLRIADALASTPGGTVYLSVPSGQGMLLSRLQKLMAHQPGSTEASRPGDGPDLRPGAAPFGA
jgi:CelD/BcsL family acetyltransferase involved in cellulose biosynthesis